MSGIHTLSHVIFEALSHVIFEERLLDSRQPHSQGLLPNEVGL